ncbi:hypothetical protein HD593_001763 [Nonomuraea rubra]|uniref:Uncharacterized protein n=1 Tax=Nonomuraea rubra TaxID=46180 RepID=A0A7X0NP32_9ACTN|nr:hypothetical protein [Nonomuraea rubra]
MHQPTQHKPINPFLGPAGNPSFSNETASNTLDQRTSVFTGKLRFLSFSPPSVLGGRRAQKGPRNRIGERG